MKAAVLTKNGIEINSVAEPQVQSNQVLVRVHVCGLNRADLHVAAGQMHGSSGGIGTIPGLEWSGEIVEVGAEVPNFKAGDRVMCSGASGYAEYAVTDWGRVSSIPSSQMSFEQAATLPVALKTMHDAIVTNGQFQKGHSVMIQGASTGVGLMGMQIAKYMGASLVIGTSTNAERRARLKDFGADLALDSSDPGWPDEVLNATGGKGVHLIVDQVSASVANQNMKAAAVCGHIVNVGRLGGFKGEFDYDLHALKRLRYIGVTFRTRSLEEVREINRKMQADLWDAVKSETLQLPIDRIFPLDEAVDALAYMKANAHFGKILMSTS
ncbi:MAG: zinc-binding dehydrogenase [SAR324 cluster bacterium]|nr:zinc-binding dehydrogenase [SAR324 cluster bacterium]